MVKNEEKVGEQMKEMGLFRLRAASRVVVKKKV
jgi:hypothetical protein